MLGNFLATHIRHCLCFQMLPCHQRPLMGCVILPALVTSLVPRIRQPMKRGLLELAAHLIAVALATVVRPADMEPSATSGTSQLEDNARPSCAEGRKLDSDFREQHSLHVLAVHPPAVREGPGANLGPLPFIRRSDLQERVETRHFLARSPN
jgi:hypothetical protein